MLKVPKLDDLTYEQMMQRAVSRIPSMTEEWTDFNHHDPGITVLQMYAWLTDMLDYYMSATGDVHVEKYRKNDCRFRETCDSKHKSYEC